MHGHPLLHLSSYSIQCIAAVLAGRRCSSLRMCPAKLKLCCCLPTHTHTHTRARVHLTALFPGLPQVSQYQKSKTNLDFTEARDTEWQWHQLGRMQVCTSLQTDNHASTPPLSFLKAGCPSCYPTNSIKALKGCCLSSPIKKPCSDVLY